jgi:hypothetical protein
MDTSDAPHLKKREANVTLKRRTKKSFLDQGNRVKTIDFIEFWLSIV